MPLDARNLFTLRHETALMTNSDSVVVLNFEESPRVTLITANETHVVQRRFLLNAR